MDYQRIYEAFIADRRTKEASLVGYSELHHISPRSLGGSDEPSNLIRLSAGDHYFAHCCLAKIHGGKMWSALFAVGHMAKTDSAAAYFAKRRMVSIARVRAAAVRSDDMKRRWSDGSFKRSRTYRAWTDAEREQRSKALVGRKADPASIARAVRVRLERQPILTFENGATGEVITARPFDFRQKSGVSQSMTSYLVSGKIKTAKGWRIVAGS